MDAPVKFKVGDLVRFAGGSWPGLTAGRVYSVTGHDIEGDPSVVDDRGVTQSVYARKFVAVTDDGRRHTVPAYTPGPRQAVPEIPAAPASGTQVGGSHYTDMAIQPLEYVMANGIPFPEGNVIKYVSRWRKKGGVQDLKKARHMLDVLIEHEEKKQANG